MTSNAMSRTNLKKRIPLIIAAMLAITLLLGFAAPAGAATVHEVSTWQDFEAAMAVIQDEDTIKLLADIDYDAVTGLPDITQNITFDVDVFILNVRGNETVLVVDGTSGGNLSLVHNLSGEFNIFGSGGWSSVLIKYGAEATVTNVYSENISSDVVNVNTATLYVLGNLTGKGIGVVLYAGQVFVDGDVTVYDIGASVSGGGEVTINGTVNVDDGTAYLSLGGPYKVKNDGDYAGSSKSGYIEYTDGYNSIWLRAICEIVDVDTVSVLKQYNDLTDALDDVLDGQTIKLLVSIDYNQGIEITDKSITFDIGDFNLNVTSSTTNALDVMDGGVALSAGNGEFNVISTAPSFAGVRAMNSTVEVSNAAGYSGVYSWNSTVTVYNDATADVTGIGTGVSAVLGSTVTVYNDVTGGVEGVHARDSIVTVYNNVTGGTVGATAAGGSRISIDGVLSQSGADDRYVVLESGSFSYLRLIDGDYAGSSKPGYFEYTDDTNYVWVKAPVCEIIDSGSVLKQYYDLGDALDDV
ncbi:MAG: hypothetical protein FWE78_01950, partial [Methanimicrococcus sp.]|nr:hypothetical protein [Methanimicrococcus sp.]